ncbi:MAG: type VI secretion system-associated FHA domain protein TagH [Burkholderiales bacterium]|nr:type VI secretion system-associated FHA domain protein TagH [Burkholderiales bacterium]
MSSITLTVMSIDASAPLQRIAQTFSGTGGTIGRDDSNTLALPDKHRRVSRLHGTVSFVEGVATLTNSSTSLPVMVGEQQLDCGQSTALRHGEQIEIGPYVLVATSDAGAVPRTPVTTVVHRPAAQHSTAPARSAPNPAVPAFRPPSPVDVPPAVPLDLDALFAPTASSKGGVGGTLGELFPPSGVASSAASLLAPAEPLAVETPPVASSVAAPSASPSGGDPFADLLSGIGSAAPTSAAPPAGGRPPVLGLPAATSADPFASLLMPGGGTPISAPVAFAATPVAPPPPTPSVIPDDFNPFELPTVTSRNTSDPLAGLTGTAPIGLSDTGTGGGLHAAPSIDSLFATPAPAAVDALLAPSAAGHGQADGWGGLLQADANSDPLALFDAPAPAPALQPMRDTTPEIGSAFVPPVAAPLARPAVSAPTPTATASRPMADPFALPQHSSAPRSATAPPAASQDALTEAFLKGAGLTPSALPQGLTPEVMQLVGSVLRSATAGAVDMLAARAATKREVQASVTIISVQANNPLKFLPNADAALMQLLGKKMPGFMRADVAMRDAFDDLRAHEVGVIAGTRAALTEVLGKFSPDILGDKLTRGSVLESLLPSARKAKLWDTYLDRYQQIRREAEDDFQSIFGRAFVQAYERETARIKGDTSGDTGKSSGGT